MPRPRTESWRPAPSPSGIIVGTRIDQPRTAAPRRTATTTPTKRGWRPDLRLLLHREHEGVGHDPLPVPVGVGARAHVLEQGTGEDSSPTVSTVGSASTTTPPPRTGPRSCRPTPAASRAGGGTPPVRSRDHRRWRPATRCGREPHHHLLPLRIVVRQRPLPGTGIGQGWARQGQQGRHEADTGRGQAPQQLRTRPPTGAGSPATSSSRPRRA